MTRLAMHAAIADALVAQAQMAHPHECCGILIGNLPDDRSGDGNGSPTCITGIIPARNIHPQPETHFEIDPQPLVDAHRHARSGGPSVLGYYHSHPTGKAAPSSTDQAQAAGDGAIWAIIAHDTIGWWEDAPSGFSALPYPAVVA